MKKRRNRGFTLAELLAVVAILIILFAVIAVNVAARQRSMTRLEFDAIAKEIYIAAQNHLTVAESQDYLGLTEPTINPSNPVAANSDFGMPDLTNGFDPDKIVYYYDYDSTNPDPTNSPKIRELMLPLYAVDYAGTFIIRYQAHPARVLDVFYSQEGKKGLLGASGTTLTVDDYNTLMGYGGGADYREGKEKERERYPKNDGSYVVGWYGGGDDIPQGEHLLTPTIEIHNEEQLYVKISDPNPASINHQLVLVVKGANGILTFKLDSSPTNPNKDRIYYNTTNNSFAVLLDDITTSGMRFADLATSGLWSPGEDLTIYAVAWTPSALTNIAKSDEKTTNSLFAGLDNGAAEIAYFRHLENLDGSQSGLEWTGGASAPFYAKQVSDLDWETKWTNWKGDDHDGWTNKTIAPLTGTNLFCPVNTKVDSNSGPVDYKLSYDGQNHVIKNVKVDYSGSSGLFGSMTVTGSEVNDLELVDFNVTASSGDAGALIGTAKGVTVTNVLARNSRPDDGSRKINASGAAGGLIGSMTNSGSVTNCAAALIVSGGTDAGGLIGSMSGGNAKNSYAGGHTDGNGQYSKTAYNVTGATAGGLIGTSSASISNCYSTCSASGTTAAGGLIGSASGTVDNSYATGLVSDTAANVHALIGAGTATGSGNSYLWIINQDQTWQKNIVDHSTTPEADVPGGITATDADKDTTTFVSFFNGTGAAQPYDTKLIASYEGKYPMHLVGASGTYAATHYGDWPMPETLVINN